jgi:hypothetical protein
MIGCLNRPNSVQKITPDNLQEHIVPCSLALRFPMLAK